MRKLESSGTAFLVLSALLFPSCHHGDHHHVIVISGNKLAGSFQSIADYLADPTVERLFNHMPRSTGSTPPDVSGSFLSSGVITKTTIPGTLKGDAVTADFTFGLASGSQLDVVVNDPSVLDAGAASFIEGSGNAFTIYTAFKSVQTLDNGATCEIHEVNIFSGIQNADGSISDLFIGQGIVGLIGSCVGLLTGDIQVSNNIGDLTAAFCGDNFGNVPQDPTKVLVKVENNLVVDTVVFLNGSAIPIAKINALCVGAFETTPGFTLVFESLQPIAGQDPNGSDLLMGEIISGQFPPDVTLAGTSITYSLESQVGSDTFFAPLPLNLTSLDIFSVVNLGVDIPGYPAPAGSGLDCLCSMAPSLNSYVIGYYSYALPGVITPTQANIHFFNVANEAQEVDAFQGPFALDALSGTVTLFVQ